MFLAVLRYDKKLIIYSIILTLLMFNLNYYIQYNSIDKALIKQVISSDPVGHLYKSGYLLLLGLFFLKIPDMVNRHIMRQKEMIEKENETKIKLAVEKHEKELLRKNLQELNNLHLELQQKSNKIEEQNEKLSDLVNTKDRLISFISHDLKNSFSTMASIIESTKENASKTEDRDISQAMEILYKHSINNQILFENLLQWAKLQRGNITVNKEKINLKEFCLQINNNMKAQFDIKAIDLIIDIPSEFFVLADRIIFTGILANLLGNAVKFTKRGGKVNIYSALSDSKIRIYIKDEGIGIKKDILPKLFSVDNSLNTQGTEGEKGSGFGLILCKELLERNGGDIEIESEPGMGTTVIVSLAGGVQN